MQTRKTRKSIGSEDRPKKRSRRSNVSIKTVENTFRPDPEGPFFAWSPVRIIRVLES